MRAIRRDLAVPLLLLCIVAGFYWKFVFTFQYDWVWGPDMAQQVLPWFEEEARQIQHSHLPLWDPHSWAGQPLLAQAQPGAAYPLNWLLFLMPRQQGHMQMVVLQWYYVIIHYMAALFCYLLCRDLGRSRIASLVAGLVFGLAGYVGTTDWPQMVNGAVWAPLVLLFLLRAGRGVRPLASAALSGLFLGIAWLSGHHQIPIYLTLMAAGVWLFFVLTRGRPDWKLAGLAALAMGIMLLVGALQILPATEYGQVAKRWVGATEALSWDQSVPYYVHQRYSLSPLSIFAIVFPGLNPHSDPFIGITGFTLVLFAIAACWKEPATRLFSCLAIASLAYALGHHSVFQGFLYSVVPMLDKARVPAMALVVFSIAAAVLAAFGADRFGQADAPVWATRITRGVLVFGLGTYALVFGVMLSKKLNWDFDDRVGITALAAVLLAALLYAWAAGNLKRSQALTLLILLLLLELGNESGYWPAHRADPSMHNFLEKVQSNGDIESFLKRQPGLFRIEAATGQLALSWPIYHNLDAVKSLTAGITANLDDIEFESWNARMLFGVAFSIAEKPEMPEQQEVYTAATGLKVYRNPGAFPRAWTVHEIIPVKNKDQANYLVRESLAQLRYKAYMTTPAPPLATCPGAREQVSFERNEPEQMQLRAEMACDGMVVVSDTFYPGWVAEVDGRPVAIYQVDSALRGVLAPKGVHRIGMRYRPKSVYLGAALTGFGVLGAIALAWVGGRDRS